MKTASTLVKAVSICLILTIFIDSFGHALALSASDANSTCGEWKVEDPNNEDDNRITTIFEQVTEEGCIASFTLTNNTGIHKDDYLIGGSYTLQLWSIDDNATVDFETYLVPGLKNKIQVSPNDPGKKALVSIKGDLTWDTYTIDLGVFALKAGLELIDIPCAIPADQVILAAIPASSVFASSGAYLRDRDFKRSVDEFENALTLFYEKANITLADVLEDAGIECTIDLVESVVGKPILMSRVVLEYAARIPVIIFDLFRYKATSASAIMTYAPPASIDLPKEKWIAFLNKNNIWLIHPDGSGLTQVTQNGDDEPRVDTFKWSPDGQALAYSLYSSTGSAIYLYDVKLLSSDLIIKDDVGGGFDWSLNGRQILYDTTFGSTDLWSNKGLWTFNLENGKRRQIVRTSAMDPQWSSEGSYILYSNPGFEPAGYGIADFDTGRSGNLPLNPNGGRGAGSCQWAPNELLIACITVSDTAPSSPELRFLNENGKILETLPLPERIDGSSWSFWSPDREKLAISYYEGSKAETDIITLRTQIYTYLSSGIISDWSSDGNWILTWESGIDVVSSISIVNVNSGERYSLGEGMIPVLQP